MSVSVRFRSPLENVSGACGIGHGDGGIARSPVDEGVGDVLSAGGGEGVDHVENTGPIAAAEVAGEVLWPLIEQGFEGGFVAFCQIHHVDVIAHAGAVMGGPVAAEHLELIATADSDLGDEREEVVGDAQGVFSDATAGMGAHGVEVAEGCDAPRVGSAAVEIREHLFNSGFGKAVGVDRVGWVPIQGSERFRGSRRRWRCC